MPCLPWAWGKGRRPMQKIPDHMQRTLKCPHWTLKLRNSEYGNSISNFITVLVPTMILLWVTLLKSSLLYEFKAKVVILPHLHFSLFWVYFIEYAITVVPFFLPFISLHPAPPLLPAFSPLSSCPWVIHIRSLAYPFPILFLTSPCPFCTYHLCFLFPVPFPHSPFSSSPLIPLHVISISVILFLF